MREVVQASLAFLGQPVMAKWDLRRFFEGQSDDTRLLIERLFHQEIAAEQLLLPTLVARKVDTRVKAVVRETRDKGGVANGTNPYDQGPLVMPSQETWLPYARTHLIGLIGVWLWIKYSDNVPQAEELLPPATSKALCNSIDTWFTDAFQHAREAVNHRMEVTIEAGRRIRNLREYFRDMEQFRSMVRRLRGCLRRVEGLS
jgi:hypothetical protein